MKWLLLSCFMLWARHGEGGALKCIPDSENGSCSNTKESGPDIPESLEVECLAGSEWVSNCHSCRCTAAGSADCTKQPACDLPNIVEPIRCKPNTTFQRGCNTCVCLESGLGLCTLKNCQRVGEAPAPSKEDLPAGSDCAPGTSWRSRCNDCVCSPQGLRFCTENPCPDEDLEPLLRCAPLSLWKKECNTCWCTSDGYPMCTRMGCSGIPNNMNFSDEDESTTTIAVAEPNVLAKVPDYLSNTVQEPDENAFYGTTVKVLDKNNYEIVEENLNDVKLKDLDEMGHNDIETNINIAKDKAFEEIVRNVNSEFNKNYKDVSTTSFIQNQRKNDFDHLTREENIPQNEANTFLHLELNERPYKNQDGKGDSFDKINQIHSYEHLEEMSSRYVDQNNIKHHILKRSVCKPNQDFQDECNTCKCSATGQSYSCTQNECMEKGKEDLDKEVEVFKESEGVDHIERHTVCKPRATFFVGCNLCNCNIDGTDFSCANKACPPPEDVEVFHELNAIKTVATPKPVIKKVCVENKMFIMNCNTCWCNEDGTSYFCTRRVCVPEYSPAEDKKTEATKIESTTKPVIKKVCVENKMFIMNCNTCWCNEDGTSYFCTRKVCVQELPDEPAIEDGKPEQLRIIKKECRPGEVFELDCNMCHCNPDGKSFSCTRRACVDEDDKNETRSRNVRAAPQEPPKSCQPGKEFRMDCNKCLCDNEGQDFSCTRIDCNALNNNNNGGTRRKRDVSQKVSADCVPGSVFDQGCNVCRCTEDGGHATCTLKRCAQAKENATADATESSFRCNPGEQFRQSCNDCSCSADGKSVYCTLRICDEDLTP